MKRKRILIPVILAALIGLLTFSVSAEAEEQHKTKYRTNPLRETSVVQPQLLATNDTLVPEAYHTTVEAAVAQMRTGMEARSSVIVIGYQGDEDADTLVDYIFDEAMAHTGVPTQGDYLLWHYETANFSWRTDSSQGKKQAVFTYTMTYLTTAAQEATMDTEVDALINQLDVDTATDYEKVSAIYDYICENITYDYTGLAWGDRMVYTAYAALIDGTAVCQGYASLFYRLALELGVDARLIAGIGNGGPHGWNIVELGGQYYNLDSTWDAELYQASSEYEYFLKCPENFDDHFRYEEYDTYDFHLNYPMATSDYDPSLDSGNVADHNGWVKQSGNWYYYINNVKATGWQYINGKWYYLEQNGVMQTGWLKAGKIWYYLSDSGAMVTGTAVINDEWHQFDSSGVWMGAIQKNGWAMEGGKWYYYQNGARTTGWKMVNGNYYYFDRSGVMQTGWLKSGNTWYYLKSSGAMATGWIKDGNTWYYLKSSGAMATGWEKVGATWYYFQPSGAMQTGWLKLGNTWYYMNSSGAMVTGSVKMGNKAYYFSASGACLNP